MDRVVFNLASPASTTTVEALQTSEPIPHVQRFKPITTMIYPGFATADPPLLLLAGAVIGLL